MAPYHYGPGKGRTVECTFCNATGLRWDRAYMEQTRSSFNKSGHHRLWNPTTGKVHACSDWMRKLERWPGGLEPATQNYNSESQEEDPKPEITAPEPVSSIIEKAIGGSAVTLATVTNMVNASYSRLKREASEADADMLRSLTETDKGILARLTASETILLDEISKVSARVELARPIEVIMPDGEKRNVGRQHKLFPDLMEYVKLRLNVLLVGPAGGGKTTATEKAAEAMGMKFYLQPMGPSVTESRLLGWVDANGKLVRTLFRDAYEHGGLFMADEMDNSNASALTTLNGALANGMVGFPDGMVMRHPDFVFVGGANTYGRGADRVYVGRQQLDGATLDRFVTVDWDYDEDFERYLAGTDTHGWVNYVQQVRKIAFANKLRVLVSPRSSIDGLTMLRAGIARDKVELVRIWASMPDDARTTIKSNLNRPNNSYSDNSLPKPVYKVPSNREKIW